MTAGNVLYLLMSIGIFVILAGVLAYQSWQQSRLGPEVTARAAPASHSAPDHALTA